MNQKWEVRLLACIVLLLTVVYLYKLNLAVSLAALYLAPFLVFPAESFSVLSYCLCMLNRNSEALWLVNFGLQFDENNSTCLWAKSCALINLGLLSEAEEALYVAADFTSYEILRSMWIIKYEKCEISEAIQYAERLIRLYPGYWYGYYARAVTNLYRSTDQNREKMISDVNTLLKMNPDSYLSYISRSLLNSELNKEDDALKDALTALRMHPDSEYLRVFVCGCYLRRYELNKAAEF